MAAERNPRIRQDLDFVPVQHQGRQLVLVRDPLGLVQEGKAIGAGLFELLALLDGTRSVRDLQTTLMRQRGGVLVAAEEVERLLRELEAACILQGDPYREGRDRVVREFAGLRVRPCLLAGRSFPAEAPLLRRHLEEILARVPAGPELPGPISALVAPHIDLGAGAPAYAAAYRLLQGAAPSRVIVLGIGHQLARDLFCLTEKDYETPLGVVQTDREAVAYLRAARPAAVSESDFAHRNEHSVEFQVLFLQHLLRGGAFTLVPVLCGSLQGALPEYSRSSYREQAGPFLDALARLIRDDPRTLVVAGVDLAHIGPKFGHPMAAAELQGRSEAHDRALLKALSERDPEAFWRESSAAEDRYHVCGFPALACLLEVLPPGPAMLLDYRVWHEQATRSAVSFAAVGFTKQASGVRLEASGAPGGG